MGSKNFNLSDQPSTDELELNLRKKLIQLALAFTQKGFPVKAFHEETWQDFHKFPLEKKRKIFGDFSSFYDIYMPVLQQPGSPNENGKLLWAAMKKFGLRPCADFFSQLEEGNIVEFYGPSGCQIFHNINFWEVSSYTFLEMFSYPFTELWTRDAATFEETKQVAIDGFSGKFKNTVNAHLPQQFLIEAFSEGKYIIQLDFTKFSPLYDSEGAIAALAIVSQGHVIDATEYAQVLKQRPHLPRPDNLFRLHVVET